MSTLGPIGLFGNQIFQYSFLALYARRHGLAIETPGWVGQRLFGISDRTLTRPARPVVTELELDVAAALAAPAPPFIDVDLWGWFLVSTRPYAADRGWLRSLFTPVRYVADVVDGARRALAARGRTVVGVHVRRGDYRGLTGSPLLDRLYLMTPVEWYRSWLEELWPTLEDPVLFVASDEPGAVLPELARFSPVTSADLGVELRAAPFYPDFHLLSCCHRLAISNSTFSFAASLLATECDRFVRPDPAAGRLVPYDPWASEPVLALRPEVVLARRATADFAGGAGREAAGRVRPVAPQVAILAVRDVAARALVGDELCRGRLSFEATLAPAPGRLAGRLSARWQDDENPDRSFRFEALEMLEPQSEGPPMLAGSGLATGPRLNGSAHFLLVAAPLPGRPESVFLALTILCESLHSIFVEAPATGVVRRAR